MYLITELMSDRARSVLVLSDPRVQALSTEAMLPAGVGSKGGGG